MVEWLNCMLVGLLYGHGVKMLFCMSCCVVSVSFGGLRYFVTIVCPWVVVCGLVCVVWSNVGRISAVSIMVTTSWVCVRVLGGMFNLVFILSSSSCIVKCMNLLLADGFSIWTPYFLKCARIWTMCVGGMFSQCSVSLTFPSFRFLMSVTGLLWK